MKLISEQTGLHPSTAHRILNDLTCGRLVERPEAGSYRLGMRLLELGNLVKARLDVRDAALKPMRALPIDEPPAPRANPVPEPAPKAIPVEEPAPRALPLEEPPRAGEVAEPPLRAEPVE